jgi:hypothetical protein
MNNANQIARLQSCRRPAAHSWAAGNALLTVLFCLNNWAADALAIKLQTATVQTWDRYVQWVDKRVQRELSDPQAFLVQSFFRKFSITSGKPDPAVFMDTRADYAGVKSMGLARGFRNHRRVG